MPQLRKAEEQEVPTAMNLIDMGREYLKAQKVNQWQTGYPDRVRIEKDIEEGKGYFLVNEDEILGYLCIDL